MIECEGDIFEQGAESAATVDQLLCKSLFPTCVELQPRFVSAVFDSPRRFIWHMAFPKLTSKCLLDHLYDGMVVEIAFQTRTSSQRPHDCASASALMFWRVDLAQPPSLQLPKKDEAQHLSLPQHRSPSPIRSPPPSIIALTEPHLQSIYPEVMAPPRRPLPSQNEEFSRWNGNHRRIYESLDESETTTTFSRPQNSNAEIQRYFSELDQLSLCNDWRGLPEIPTASELHCPVQDHAGADGVNILRNPVDSNYDSKGKTSAICPSCTNTTCRRLPQSTICLLP